jgi:hypothetical protein
MNCVICCPNSERNGRSAKWHLLLLPLQLLLVLRTARQRGPEVTEEATTDLLEVMITVTATVTATEGMKDTGLQGMSESHCGCPKVTESDGK